RVQIPPPPPIEDAGQARFFGTGPSAVRATFAPASTGSSTGRAGTLRYKRGREDTNKCSVYLLDSILTWVDTGEGVVVIRYSEQFEQWWDGLTSGQQDALTARIQ